VSEFLFFFFKGHTHRNGSKFLGQGLNPSHSFDLCHSCSNPDPWTQCARLGIKPTPPQQPQATEVGFLTYCTTSGTPRISFLFKGEYYSIVCTGCTLFSHSTINGHLGYLQPSLMYFFFLSFFAIFGAAPVAYAGSKARGRIGAIAAAYATATAAWDPSCICDLHHSSRQHRILNPLSKVRDWTHNLMVSCRICEPLSHEGNSPDLLLKYCI